MSVCIKCHTFVASSSSTQRLNDWPKGFHDHELPHVFVVAVAFASVGAAAAVVAVIKSVVQFVISAQWSNSFSGFQSPPLLLATRANHDGKSSTELIIMVTAHLESIKASQLAVIHINKPTFIIINSRRLALRHTKCVRVFVCVESTGAAIAIHHASLRCESILWLSHCISFIHERGRLRLNYGLANQPARAACVIQFLA